MVVFIEFLFILLLPIVISFSPDKSSFDAYGLKLAMNDVLLVESDPTQSLFYLQLAPFNYSLTCTMAYNDSNQYIYVVAVHRQATTNDSIQFVFIGINTETEIPFIGSLKYTGITGEDYVATTKITRKSVFPCTGWQQANYRIHELKEFTSNESNEEINNEFIVVTIG